MIDREFMECGPEALREMVTQLEEQLRTHRTFESAIEAMRQPVKEVMAAIRNLSTPPLSEMAPQLAVLREINSKLDQFIAITTRITEMIEQ